MATPIGNMRDITLRALDVLKSVSLVAAEDTRVTQHLLAHYGIEVPMMAVHEHNEARAGQRVLDVLAQGRAVALTTDAGTPAISDPGGLLVQRIRAAGFRIVPVPGASAAITALSVSGFASAPFLFWGFLPPQTSARTKILQKLARLQCLLVFYEAPHRIKEAVQDLHATLGQKRQLIIARELTKAFESVHSCTLAEAAAWLDGDANRLRGEFVLIVEGAQGDADASAELDERVLRVLLAELPVSQAAKLAAQITSAKRNAMYALALRLAQGVAAPLAAETQTGASMRRVRVKSRGRNG